MTQSQRILVVSHDAGGAEIVSAWVKKYPGPSYTFILEGPAGSIFQKKIPGLNITPRNEVLNSNLAFDLVLTGTGWGSDLEIRLVDWAKRRGLRVASYLDHWVNYRERFVLEGGLILPDEIWAGDRYAHDLAGEIFPDCRVILEPNLYFQEILTEVGRISPFPEPGRGQIRILYVCEPTSMMAEKKYGDPRYLGYTEFEALEGYLHWLENQATIINKIRIRLHPAEPPGKYRQTLEPFQDVYAIEESQARPLVADCAWADWIVGCQSMALVIGVLAGKRVFSCIPTGGPPSWRYLSKRLCRCFRVGQ